MLWSVLGHEDQQHGRGPSPVERTGPYHMLRHGLKASRTWFCRIFSTADEAGLPLVLILWTRTPRTKEPVETPMRVDLISINMHCFLNYFYKVIGIVCKRHLKLRELKAHHFTMALVGGSVIPFHTWFEHHFAFCRFIVKQLYWQTVLHPPSPQYWSPKHYSKEDKRPERQINWWPGLILNGMNNAASLSSPGAYFNVWLTMICEIFLI